MQIVAIKLTLLQPAKKTTQHGRWTKRRPSFLLAFNQYVGFPFVQRPRLILYCNQQHDLRIIGAMA